MSIALSSFPPDRVLPPARARVLLAEDDDELRTLIAENLGAAGHEVIEAQDGEALIERLIEALLVDENALGFDVIVSDIQMPTFSALDVMVGAHRLIGETPVVLITAFGDNRTHENALLRGAAVVLDKPVRMTLLCETVANLLAGGRPSAPAPATAL